MVKQSAFR